ncbi:MAG: HupE/UreJ family protein [Myxococcota bacterium]|nr:HupE/UreJ family protein [Myxococcota bacterium]
MSKARALALFVVVVATSLASSRVAAHLGSTKYLHVDATAEGARVIADIDPIDVAYELELDEAAAAPHALLARASEIRAWAVRSFVVRSDSGPCDARASAPELVSIDGAMRSHEAIRVTLDYTCSAPRTHLVLHDGSVFGGDPQHEAIVRVGERATILRAGRQDAPIGDAPAAGATVAAFFALGAIHLVTGYDHVLFLLSLLLCAGLVAARIGTRAAMRDIALVVTGFTVGHSVTLIAAALDVVTVPSRIVESAIAASIVAVAVWNLIRPDARAALPWVAVAFGLVHGFGFSSVLRELVLPTGERIAALLAFNVGIEVAQLAIVALTLPLLAWAARRAWYERAVVRGGSIAIALIGLGWFLERALGA